MRRSVLHENRARITHVAAAEHLRIGVEDLAMPPGSGNPIR